MGAAMLAALAGVSYAVALLWLLWLLRLPWRH